MSTRLTLSQLIWRVALVLVLAAIAGGAALAISHTQPKSYTATSQLVYGVTLRPELQALGAGTNDATQDTTRINTEVAVLNSHDIAQRTAKADPGLGLSAQDISDKVKATAENESLVADLVVTDTSPSRAVRLLHDYRNQYLKVRRAGEKQRARTVAKALKSELNGLPHAERTGSRGAELRQQLGALTALEHSGSGVPEVSENAYAPATATAPKTMRNVIFGVLFGLALGIGLLAIRPAKRSTGSTERHYDRPGAERDLEEPVTIER